MGVQTSFNRAKRAVRILGMTSTLACIVGVLGCEHDGGSTSNAASERSAEEIEPVETAPEPTAPASIPQKAPARREVSPDDIERVSVHDARRRVQSGEALLVLAYPDEERFRRQALDGAISFATLQERIPSMAADREVIFY